MRPPHRSTLLPVKLDPDFVPSTMEEAADTLVGALEPEELKEILADYEKWKGEYNPTIVTVQNGLERRIAPYYCAFRRCGHFFGMGMRNTWSFWSDTPIRRECIERWKIAHGDDLWGLLSAWATAKILGEPFDPEKHCERYHEHWKASGLTALEAAGIK